MRSHKRMLLMLCMSIALTSGCTSIKSTKTPVIAMQLQPSIATKIVMSNDILPVVPEIKLDIEESSGDTEYPSDWIADFTSEEGLEKNLSGNAIVSAEMASVFEQKQLEIKKAEEEAAKKKALAEAKKKAEEEARKKAEAEAKLKAEEEAKKLKEAELLASEQESLAKAIQSRAYSDSKITVYQSDKNDIPTDTSKLLKAINRDGDICSVLAVRLSDGASVGYNVDKELRCMSTFKAPMALYVYKQLEAGLSDLTDTMTYKSKYYYSGSGIIRKSSYGKTYSLKTLTNYSITYSDNVAYLMLLDYFGSEGVSEMVKSFGCSLYDNILTSNWPTITAREAALWWSEIYNFCLTAENGKTLWNIFLNSAGSNVKQALNNQYSVAHKSGSGSGYYHDCGIVMCDDPYLYVILTYERGTGDDNKSYFKPIAAELDNLMNNN